MSKKVTVYTGPNCWYCTQAKRLLEKKGIAYEEVNLAEHPELREEVQRRSGRRTVPQIFVEERSLGGFDDIKALDDQGELDPILS